MKKSSIIIVAILLFIVIFIGIKTVSKQISTDSFIKKVAPILENSIPRVAELEEGFIDLLENINTMNEDEVIYKLRELRVKYSFLNEMNREILYIYNDKINKSLKHPYIIENSHFLFYQIEDEILNSSEKRRSKHIKSYIDFLSKYHSVLDKCILDFDTKDGWEDSIQDFFDLDYIKYAADIYKN